MIKKEKKITVKYFFNNDVKPIVAKGLGENGTDLKLYRLYIQVVYNRKSAKFKFIPDLYYKEGEDIYTERYKKYLDLKERLITRIVEYEVKRQGNKFKLRGLGERLKFYENYVANEIEQDLSKKIDTVMKLGLSKTDYNKVKKLSLYEKVLLINEIFEEGFFKKEFGFILKNMALESWITLFNKKLRVFSWLFNSNTPKKFEAFLEEKGKELEGKSIKEIFESSIPNDIDSKSREELEQYWEQIEEQKKRFDSININGKINESLNTTFKDFVMKDEITKILIDKQNSMYS